MKHFRLFRMFCKCSWRMRARGKLCRIYTTPTTRTCPNCKKKYLINNKHENLKELSQRKLK